MLSTSCGFQPMYGKNTAREETASVTQSLNQIQLGNIPDREGQILRNLLVDRFYADGLPSDARYRLDVKNYHQSQRDLDITIRSDATRRQLRIRADMELLDLKSGKVVFKRQVSGTGSYNILDSQYTTRVSRMDVEKNIIRDLSIQIERQVVLYLNGIS